MELYGKREKYANLEGACEVSLELGKPMSNPVSLLRLRRRGCFLARSGFA